MVKSKKGKQKEFEIKDEKQIKKWLKLQSSDDKELSYYQQTDSYGRFIVHKIKGYIDPDTRELRVICLTPQTIPQDAIKLGVPKNLAYSLFSETNLRPLLEQSNDNLKVVKQLQQTTRNMLINTIDKLNITNLYEQLKPPYTNEKWIYILSLILEKYGIPIVISYDRFLDSKDPMILPAVLKNTNLNVNQFLDKRFHFKYTSLFSNPQINWRNELIHLMNDPLGFYVKHLFEINKDMTKFVFSSKEKLVSELITLLEGHLSSQYINEKTIEMCRRVYTKSSPNTLEGDRYVEFQRFILAVLSLRGGLDVSLSLSLVQNEKAMQEFIYSITNWSYYLPYYLDKTIGSIEEKDYELYETLGDKSVNHASATYLNLRFQNKFGLHGNEQMTESIKYMVSKAFLSQLSDQLDLVRFVRFTPAMFRIHPNESLDKDHGDVIQISADTDKLKTDILEGFMGALEYLVNTYIQFGLGFSTVYNIMASLLDEKQLTIDVNELKDDMSKMKELMEQTANVQENIPNWSEFSDKYISYNIKNIIKGYRINPDLQYEVQVEIPFWFVPDFPTQSTDPFVKKVLKHYPKEKGFSAWGKDPSDAQQKAAKQVLDYFKKEFGIEYTWKGD
jgi:dsRNA-specific ribonuclease